MPVFQVPILRKTLAAFSALFLSLANPASAQSSNYRLAPGDVLQLSVVGFPDMKQRTPINVDGEVMLPLIGNLRASGQTVNELSSVVKGRFANKVLQQRSPDGRTATIVVAPDEVTIDILEYRPIYVRGDVAKPGEQFFRPGMTARQAVAVAGGYDLVRMRATNPIQESAKLRGEAMTYWAEILLQQAAVWRLQVETSGKETAADQSIFEKSPLQKAQIEAAYKTHADQLAARRAERQRDVSYYQSVIAQSDHRISLLAEQQKNEEEGSKQDVDDFERVSKLFEKGNASITRFSDSRRSMLLSATRILQTSAAMAQVEREREEFKKLLANLDDKRRLEAFKDLHEAEIKLEQAKAKLASAQEQLLYSNKMRSQLGFGGDSNAEIVIIRQSERGRQRLTAQEDTELAPGDAVEVALDVSQILSFLPN